MVSSTKKDEGAPEVKTANDIYQEMKKKEKEGEEERKVEGKEKASEEEKRAKILDMIEKNINRKYFSEKKFDAFLDQCFSLKNPAAFI